MALVRMFFFTLLISTTIHVSTSDESEELDDAKNSFEDTVGESMKGMSNWFKGMADGVKDTAESGVETLKGLSTGAKEMSEDGAEKAAGWAGGVGDSFSNAKDKILESGEKMKEAIGHAATNTKDEMESVASKLSKHAKEASDTMMKMFG